MAEVYDFVRGERLERLIARCEETQRPLRRVADRVAARASENLAAAQSHDENVSRRARIELTRDSERPDIDWLIELSDEAGWSGAMSIEYGREGGRMDSIGRIVTPMKPLWILHFVEVEGG